jgi:hypothetical protein
MKQAAILAAMCVLVARPAAAESPAATATIKLYEAVAADPARLKIFCEMITFAAKSDDVDEATMDGFLDRLGKEFREAWTSEADPTDDPQDSELIDEAIGNLYVACE